MKKSGLRGARQCANMACIPRTRGSNWGCVSHVVRDCEQVRSGKASGQTDNGRLGSTKAFSAPPVGQGSFSAQVFSRGMVVLGGVAAVRLL